MKLDETPIDGIRLPCCACAGKAIFASPDTTVNPTVFHTIPWCTRFDTTNTIEELLQYMRDCSNASSN